jgi:hypothetical protein
MRSRSRGADRNFERDRRGDLSIAGTKYLGCASRSRSVLPQQGRSTCEVVDVGDSTWQTVWRESMIVGTDGKGPAAAKQAEAVCSSRDVDVESSTRCNSELSASEGDAVEHRVVTVMFGRLLPADASGRRIIVGRAGSKHALVDVTKRRSCEGLPTRLDMQVPVPT